MARRLSTEADDKERGRKVEWFPVVEDGKDMLIVIDETEERNETKRSGWYHARVTLTGKEFDELVEQVRKYERSILPKITA